MTQSHYFVSSKQDSLFLKMILNRSQTFSLCWMALFLLGSAKSLVWNGAGSDTRWALECDFINRDFKNQLSTNDKCGSLCKANPPCSHFTWTNYQGGTCWMKVGFVSEFNAVSKTTDEAVCGFLKSTSSPVASSWKDGGTFIWTSSCDFENRDYKSLPAVNSNSCGPTCSSDPLCSHFTWTNYQGGTCWLKTGGASECDAIVKTDSGAVCGFVKF